MRTVAVAAAALELPVCAHRIRPPPPKNSTHPSIVREQANPQPQPGTMRRHNWTIRQPAQHVNVPSVQCNEIPALRYPATLHPCTPQQPLDFHCSQGGWKGVRREGSAWFVRAASKMYDLQSPLSHRERESSGLSVPGSVGISFLLKVNFAFFAVGRCLCCISFFFCVSLSSSPLHLLFLFDFIAFAFVFTI